MQCNGHATPCNAAAGGGAIDPRGLFRRRRHLNGCPPPIATTRPRGSPRGGESVLWKCSCTQHHTPPLHPTEEEEKNKEKTENKKTFPQLSAIIVAPIHDEALPPPLASCPCGRQRFRCFILCAGSCARCCPRMRTGRGAKANQEEIHARMAFLCQQGTACPSWIYYAPQLMADLIPELYNDFSAPPETPPDETFAWWVVGW